MALNAMQSNVNTLIVAPLDIWSPQVDKEMFYAYGDAGQAWLYTRAFGYEKEVSGESYKHFEKNNPHDTFVQEANTAANQPGAGLPITLTLDPTKIDGTKFYIRQGDVLGIRSGVTGFVRDAPYWTGPALNVDVYPSDNTQAIGAVPGGTELSILYNIYSEESGFSPAVTSGTQKYTNTMAIIKEKVVASGTELTNQIYTENGESYFVYDKRDVLYRMLLHLDGLFFEGQQVDNTAARAVDPRTGLPYTGSEGLIPFLQRKGNPAPYTIGAWDVKDLDYYAMVLKQNYVPSTTPIWMPAGMTLYQEIENKIVTYLANTNVQFAQNMVNDRLFKGAKDNNGNSMAIHVNFKYFLKSDYTFCFQNLDTFSNPTTFGNATYKYTNMGFCIPLDKGSDAVTEESIPTIGMRYKGLGSMKRRFVIDTLSGIGATPAGMRPTQEADTQQYYALMHYGCEFFGGNRMVHITG